jgi:hypothetical protein
VLANFENPSAPGQVIQFIEKIPATPGGTALRTVNDGTTNQEVLAVLVNRLEFLMKKLPSRETALALTKFQEGLHWLETRTALRKVAGVEGTNAPIPTK